MAFTSFSSIQELATRFGIRFDREPFVRPVAGATLSPILQTELAYTLRRVPFEGSEVATREAIIYPVLRDVWKHYDEHLSLVSGKMLHYDNELRGEVDYAVCGISALGPLVPGPPYLLVGSHDALGGMIAAQKISANDRFTYYGLTSFGLGWRFGKLEALRFTKDPRVFGFEDLDTLAGALHFVFAACRDQLLLPPAPP